MIAATVVAITASRNGGGLSKKQVQTYQDALFPLVQEWGRIEVQGMRPAIADLQTPEEGVPPEAIGTEAEAWRAGLVRLRQAIAAIEAPGSLREASRLFDQSIVRYIDAAEVFRAAARSEGAARDDGIERGIDAVGDGTRLYNEAALVLQRARRAAGLPTSPDFPNKPAGEEIVS